MAIALRRNASGVRAIVPWHQVEQRIGIARLGRENGRWSQMIAEMAIALAPKASAAIDANLWVEWLDEMTVDIEQNLVQMRGSGTVARAKRVTQGRTFRK